MTEDSEKVTIAREEYDHLVRRDAFLSALQAAGVDNWEGYSHAQEIFEEFDD